MAYLYEGLAVHINAIVPTKIRDLTEKAMTTNSMLFLLGQPWSSGGRR